MEKTVNKIFDWKSREKHYFSYIDENLIYHLYLRYFDHTEEVYRQDIYDVSFINSGKWGLSYCCGYAPSKKEVWLSSMDNYWENYNGSFPYVFITKDFTVIKDLYKKLPALKYIDLDYETKFNLWEFVKVLYFHPEMEFIYKNKYTRFLWNEKRIYKLDEDKKKQVMNFLRLYGNEALWCESYNEVMWCVNNPNKRKKEEYEKHLQIQRIESISKRLDPNYVYKRYEKEINKLGFKEFKMFYKDYLSMSKELGINNLYPRSIRKAHDELVELKEAEGLKERIITEERYMFLCSLCKNFKNLHIEIPQIRGDFKNITDKLDNCVYAETRYFNQMKNGEGIILTINTNEKPVECCEIKINKENKLTINQLYGKHNTTKGKYHKDARKIVNMFIKNYEKEIRA